MLVYDEIVPVIDSICAHTDSEHTMFCITGGEPLLNPQWYEISVANGAAVYSALKEIYRLNNTGITIKRHVQNDDLYLGLSAGANDLLIATGDELPYTTEIAGYRIVPGTQSIEIPIKRGEENGEPQTIARGIITFGKGYQSSVDLKIEASFDQTGLLAIKAFLYNQSGVQIESGTVEMAIGAPMEKSHGGGRIIPANGSVLIAANEIDSLKNLFSKKNKSKNRQAQIESKMQTILNCGNPEDFESVVLKHLAENNDFTFRKYLYSIVRELNSSWTVNGRKRFIELAQKDIISLDFGFQVDDRRKKLSVMVQNLLSELSNRSDGGNDTNALL